MTRGLCEVGVRHDPPPLRYAELKPVDWFGKGSQDHEGGIEEEPGLLRMRLTGETVEEFRVFVPWRDAAWEEQAPRASDLFTSALRGRTRERWAGAQRACRGTSPRQTQEPSREDTPTNLDKHKDKLPDPYLGSLNVDSGCQAPRTRRPGCNPQAHFMILTKSLPSRDRPKGTGDDRRPRNSHLTKWQWGARRGGAGL